MVTKSVQDIKDGVVHFAAVVRHRIVKQRERAGRKTTSTSLTVIVVQLRRHSTLSSVQQRLSLSFLKIGIIATAAADCRGIINVAEAE